MNNTLLLNEKTNEILNRIENCKSKKQDTFLLNLWKNYILNKKNAYQQTLEDCEKFLEKTENASDVNEISFETVLLLYYSISNINS